MTRSTAAGPTALTLGAPLGTADDADMLAHVVGGWRSAVTQRLRDEAAGAQALAVMPSLVYAWARM
jgi:hypothetical protein